MEAEWLEQIDQAVDERFEQMRAVRRHLHANPEPSGEEYQTSLHLYQLLGDEGFHVRMGPEGRGVVADVAGPDDDFGAGLFALRADIDALRIQDQKQVDYRSRNERVMHACGHDAHSAMAFGALTTLKTLHEAGKLPWPVRLRGIFQPAEETSTGAREMIEAGSLKGVSAILALHVDPTRRAGAIGVRSGVLTANCDTMQIRIVGRGGHAARPHETRDPIATASQLISALYLHVPRATDSQEAVVATIGQVLAGDNPNVIPEMVELRGTLRTLDHRIRLEAIRHIEQLCEGIARATDTKITVKFELGSESVTNDGGMTELIRRAARPILGDDAVEEIPRPSMGSEDFAFYLKQVPGAMFRLGVADGNRGKSPLHTPTFDIAEEALATGAKVLARTAALWFDPQARRLPSSPLADAAPRGR